MTAAATLHPRDYSLTGPLNARSQEIGLANAQWYRTEIPRAKLKELMQRTDGPATIDSLMYLGLLIVTGGLAAYFWGTWWCVPFFFVYGTLYGSGADSRWHEMGHGTAFRTAWKNEAMYQIACFLIIRNPTAWRWSHSRHHTDTIIVGRDPEIITPRPPKVGKLTLNVFGILDAPLSLMAMLRYATGNLNGAEKDYIPVAEQPKVAFVARIWTAIYLAVIVACFYMGSILPLMLIGLPRLYGAWHHILTGVTQHIGLAEDVLDHRLNCRTVYMNPFSRFVYMNMNYHVEHHMYPMVPYHRLPELHEAMKADTPKPYSGFFDAYREILPTLARQLREPEYFVRRVLPPTARPSPPLPEGARVAHHDDGY